MNIGILRPPAGIGGAETSMIELYLHLKNTEHNCWINFDIENNNIFKNFIDFDLFKKRYFNLTNEIFSENLYLSNYLIDNIKNTDVFFILQYRILNKEIKEELKNKKNINIYVPGKNSVHITEPLKDGINIDFFIFNSEETLKYHMNIIYDNNKEVDMEIKKKFVYLHPPLNIKHYLKINEIDYKNYRLENLNIKKDEFSIGVVGRIQPSKCPTDALDIFKGLEKYYNYDVFPRKLYFIGNGEKDYLKTIFEYSDKLNIKKYIVITGMLFDASYYIKSMDSILHCCKMESLSRSIRESMLLKKPVIAYDNFGNKNLFNLKDTKKLLYTKNIDASSHLVKIGTNGKLKKEFSNIFFENISLLENDKYLNYYNFLKKYE